MKNIFSIIRIVTLCFGISLVHLNHAMAATKTYFAFGGGQVIITMIAKTAMGSDDPGPAQLYNALKIEPVNSFIGKGKVLKDAKQNMTFIVADRGQGQYEVSVVLKKSENIQIDSNRKFAEVRFLGQEAQNIFKSWKSLNNKFEFTNQDGTLKVSSTPDLFILNLQE